MPWLVKNTYDEDGLVTAKEVVTKFSGIIKTPDGHEVFRGDESLKNPKIEKVGDKWVMSEDSDAAKVDQVTVKYNELNTDVYAEMARVFGTTNPDSATAYSETWKLMNESPADFASLGITADFAIGGFNLGDAIDTSQKVTDYSAALLDRVKQYAIFRVNRINQFRSERGTILA